MSLFIVEKNIKMPVAKPKKRKRFEKYPWSKMQIGDSFFVPNKITSVMSAAAVTAAKRNPGTKFSVRQMTDGVRIWRIA
jgi:hypothetical protein